MRNNKHRPVSAAQIALLASVLLAAAADSQTSSRHDIRIEAQSLAAALKELAAETGLQIIVMSDDANDKRAPAIAGSLTNEEALQRILRDTGLTYQKIDANTVAIRRSGTPTSSQDTHAGERTEATRAATADAVAGPRVPDTENAAEENFATAGEAAAVVVTGSRIRGAPSASPVITITQQQMLEAGQSNLGDVVRSLPQNFSGGQNPGVASGTGATNPNNGNVTGGSSLNLRGLGPDATLTLLNGRRLSYDSFNNGVDISTIPLAAVERIEVVADGASALYGSDAVAGVANVILKRDYEGLSTTARVATATEGGDFQQQYSLVGGHRWSGGGFIATYNGEDDRPVYADQRDYTGYLSDPYSIYQGNRSQGVVVSGHQDLGSLASFSLDALYNHRVTSFVITSSPTFTAGGTRTATSYTASPTLDFKLPHSWTVSLSGTYGRDEVNTDESYGNPLLTLPFSKELYCECNRDTSAEFDAEGALVRLPAGESRLAVGSGYRVNTFSSVFVGQAVNTYGSRSSRYAFGELFVPLIASEQNVGYADRLSFTAAARYERYSDFGGVATPKLAVVYAPTRDVDIKGSWGRSFKTPTLSQEFQGDYALLYPATTLGATGLPTTAAALYRSGGNLDLQPEHATTWDATLDWHPAQVAGLDVEVSYFSIVYRDRIVSPISVISAAFTNPVYRQFVTYSPTVAQQQAAIAAATLGFYNYTGSAYDPANVIGLVNGLQANATRQDIEGVDLAIDYHFSLGGGLLTLSDRSSWLESRQQTSDSSPETDLSGTVYNSPRWRSRTGATWSSEPVTASVFYNYLGGVRNILVTPVRAGGSMSTVDVAVIYRLPASDYLLRNVDLTLAVQNVTDAKPPYLNTNGITAGTVSYDSTNYSALGRLINLTIGKRW